MRMRIQILVDNKNSWIIPYAQELSEKLIEEGHICQLIFEHKKVSRGDILCLLGCEKIFKKLELNKHNLVVHESDLPRGKGWSPLTWQILEGKNQIPVSLFEAVESIDAGKLYSQEIISLKGTELLPEIKHKQGLITQKLILNFIRNYPNFRADEQKGESTFYSKRSPEDSRLDPHKTIADQFNLLRVCDNERYPAYFTFKNKKYILKIYSEDD